MADCCLIKKVATVEVYENKNEVRAYGFMAGDRNTPVMEVRFKHLWGESNLSSCKLRWIIVDDVGSLLVGEVPIQSDNTALINLPNELFTGDRRMKVQLTVASCDGERILNLQQFTDLKVVNSLAPNEVVEPVYQILINQLYDETQKYLSQLDTLYTSQYGSLENLYVGARASLEQYLITAENGGNAEFLQGYSPAHFQKVENTISDLIASTKYKVGDIVEVLGYYEKGDGAGHPRIKKPVGYNGADAVIGADGSIWGIVHSGEILFSWFGNKEINKALEYCRKENANFISNDKITISNTVVLFERNEFEQNYPNFHTCKYNFNGEVTLINSTFSIKTVKSNYYFSKLKGNGLGNAITLDDCQGSNVVNIGEISGFDKGVYIHASYTHTLNVNYIVNCNKGMHLKNANAININNGRIGGNFSYGDVDLDPYSCDIGIHIEGGSSNNINGTNVEYCKRTANSIGILDEGCGTKINDIYIESCKSSLLFSRGHGSVYNISTTATNMQTNKSIILNGRDCVLNLKNASEQSYDVAISVLETTPAFKYPADCYTDGGVNNKVNITNLKDIVSPYGINLINDNFNLENKYKGITGAATGGTWIIRNVNNERYFKRNVLSNTTKLSGDQFYYTSIEESLFLNNVNTYNIGIGLNVTKGSYKVMLKVQDVKIQSITQILNIGGDKILNFKFKKYDTVSNAIVQLYLQPLEDNSEIEMFAPYLTIGEVDGLMPYQETRENFFNNVRTIFNAPSDLTQLKHMDFENIAFNSGTTSVVELIDKDLVNVMKPFNIFISNPSAVNRLRPKSGQSINGGGLINITSNGVLFNNGLEWEFIGQHSSSFATTLEEPVLY